MYLNPPDGAVVYSVDEKSQVQALARSQPTFPMMPYMPERRTHDYLRHGTTSLFPAFNTADGTVISSLHRRHRAVEFRKFLAKIDATVPDGLEVHLVCDNYGTHKAPSVKAWLAGDRCVTQIVTARLAVLWGVVDDLVGIGDRREVLARRTRLLAGLLA